MANGSIQHCAHGKGSTIHDIVDWRRFDYITYHIRTPLGTVVRQMAEFTPLQGGGTQLSLRCAKPESGNALKQALVRFVLSMTSGKLVKDQRASKVALEQLVAQDLAIAGTEAA